GLPLAALKLGQIKPYQRGFFCNDDSISYPFHHSTITSNVLYGLGFTLPICSMVFGECLSVYLKRIKSKSSFSNMYVACVYKAIGTFVFGAAMSQSLTDIAKYSIGRLRPHFLDDRAPGQTRVLSVCGPADQSVKCLWACSSPQCLYQPLVISHLLDGRMPSLGSSALLK
ncbi:unnamed protein product, partial [Coregonus sp. 'balchen']